MITLSILQESASFSSGFFPHEVDWVNVAFLPLLSFFACDSLCSCWVIEKTLKRKSGVQLWTAWTELATVGTLKRALFTLTLISRLYIDSDTDCQLPSDLKKRKTKAIFLPVSIPNPEPVSSKLITFHYLQTGRSAREWEVFKLC